VRGVPRTEATGASFTETLWEAAARSADPPSSAAQAGAPRGEAAQPSAAPVPAREGARERTSATRTAVLWVPDWPVVAAMHRGEVETHVPAAVHDGRHLVAVSAVARAQGVRRGMRRRTAQGVCPELVLLGVDEGRDAVVFEAVAQAAEGVVPGIEVVRPGLLLVPVEGAARYHGSTEAFGEALVDAVVRAGFESQLGVADGLLAALLAAREHAVVPPGRSPEFLAPHPVGALAHAAVDERSRAATRRLVDLLVRLGITSLGALAALPVRDVEARFGELGAWAHRLVRGEDPRPPVRRRPEPDLEASCELDPPAMRLDVATFAGRRLAEDLHAQLLARSASCARLEVTARTEHGAELTRTWRTDLGGLGGLTAARITDRIRWQLEGWLDRAASAAEGDPERGAVAWLGVTAREVSTAADEQGRLWGGASGVDVRAHRALDRVQGLLGPQGVLTAALQGGRDLRDQVHLAPWGASERAERPVDRPWPGRLPAPAPATVLPAAEPVVVLDAAGRPVTIDERWQISAAPARVRWLPARREGPGGRGPGRAPGSENRYGGAASEPCEGRVVAWAGPWPLVERWWTSEGRARAHVQAVFEDGGAVLLAWSAGAWTCEARYD